MSLFDLSREMTSSPNALLSDHQKWYLIPNRIIMETLIFNLNNFLATTGKGYNGHRNLRTFEILFSLIFSIFQVAAGGNVGRQVTEEEVRRAMSQAIVRQV